MLLILQIELLDNWGSEKQAPAGCEGETRRVLSPKEETAMSVSYPLLSLSMRYTKA
jgi:hypothetical protein